ncbi:MAG: N-acetyl-gamma-glutamyl-phosphate reductase [Candidatus Omnitrophica bacterium]|nr:N-acetyl-gamma-glutamyl-phosphate reductase [Candidatus Omnitrophota bacterium]
MKKSKVGIVGASGFTGEELIRLLLSHPFVEITYLSAIVDSPIDISQLFPKFKNRLELVCKNLDIDEATTNVDIVFLALPHKVSYTIAPKFLDKNKIVIDLSADYRLKDLNIYEKYYKAKHLDPKNLKQAVYGLPEFYRAKIKTAKLIANPGCYPTASILALAPLLKENLIKNIIIDAKSAITGAGRKPLLEYHFAHLYGNLFAYKVFGHQHLPEIIQILSEVSKKDINLRFTPHVLPIERGILVTIYANLTKKVTQQEIEGVYQKYYSKEPFVRFFKQKLPNLKDVIYTNFCDIGFQCEGKNIVIVCAIDNLMKGAAGQAVQNMNIICGFDERLALV